MIDYRRLGAVAAKPHTVFKIDGKMVAEHVFTREGFNDLYSIFYQERAPTHEVRAEMYESNNPNFPTPKATIEKNLRRRHIKTPLLKEGKDILACRTTLFLNEDCAVGVAKPTQTANYFFSNGDCDELYFVAEGEGKFQSIFGVFEYKQGDYIFIPKSVPHRFVFKGAQNFLITEGKRGFGIPREFRHPHGQLRMDAPYTHRDFKSPTELLNFKKDENYPIVVLRNDSLTSHEYTEWPYRVHGWDGWVYPFGFSIYDYQARTGLVHLPPNIHTVFAGAGFVVCNFVPRIVDFHENAVPCPYPHSSVDCDEILFYVSGDFTSRKGISNFSMSFHPGGIPHGPHPGMYEKSVGSQKTTELAVMIDTFAPLQLTEAARSIEDNEYHFSWNTKENL